jgi:hypothetical protein
MHSSETSFLTLEPVMNFRALGNLAAAGFIATTTVFCTQPTDSTDSASSKVESNSAKVLVISDIDDTIKMANVRSGGLGTVVGALGVTNAFSGMVDVYRGLAKIGDIKYLTAAPAGVKELGGLDFLNNAHFPPEATISKAIIGGAGFGADPGEFKAEKLAALYDDLVKKKAVPDTFVLIGDNGQKDIDAYATFANYLSKKGSTAKVFTFIHHVYEYVSSGPALSTLQPGQIEYLTAADLGVQLFKKGLIDLDTVAAAFRQVGANDKDNVATVKPAFMQCEKFTGWPLFSADIPAGVNVAQYFELGAQNADIANDVLTLCESPAAKR